MWADVTMVYQGEFSELWECYRKLRLVKSRDRMFNCHNYDQVRLIQQNIPGCFTQVYILDQQTNYIGDSAWALESREFEGSIAFARVFVLKQMADAI
jgi:hypothetical protein